MGTLYIVATPIGNLEDCSIRSIRVLFSSDAIASEDTRRTGALLQELRKRFPEHVPSGEPALIRYDDRTELSQTAEIVALLESGKQISLVTDAGTPLISDPGYVLVKEARKRSIPVHAIPGPSAVVAALSVSGLPVDKFLFLGYPPEKQSHRIKQFETIQTIMEGPIGPTAVWYVAPHKLEQTLLDMKSVFGAIDISLARELTKVYEDSWTGSLDAALKRHEEFKGELVLMIHLSR